MHHITKGWLSSGSYESSTSGPNKQQVTCQFANGSQNATKEYREAMKGSTASTAKQDSVATRDMARAKDASLVADESGEINECDANYLDYDDFALGSTSGGGARIGKASQSDKKDKGGGGIYSSKHTRIRESRPKKSGP